MDSRLLNVIYDDPFDGNYVKFDNETELWPGSSETMGMQLTETLHGILPIAPTDEFHKDNTTCLTFQNKNALIYEDLAEQHIAVGREVEIVTADCEADGYDTDIENEGNDSDYDEGDRLEYEQRSHYSNSTFRTRTDSSSIGDYESHTSDYDDDVGDIYHTEEPSLQKSNLINISDCVANLQTDLLTSEDVGLDRNFKLPLNRVVQKKDRTISTSTIGSDVDVLGLQIDANTFDLADFITKDDFLVNVTSTTELQPSDKVKVSPYTNLSRSLGVQPIVHIISKDDSDSDVFVDVETVENEDETESNLRAIPTAPSAIAEEGEYYDFSYVDNVKKDPSWSPNQVKKSETPAKEQKLKHKSTARSLSGKKTTDLLKRKFDSGRGRCSTLQRNGRNVGSKWRKTCAKSAIYSLKCPPKVEKSDENLKVVNAGRTGIAGEKSKDDASLVNSSSNDTFAQPAQAIAKSANEAPADVTQCIKRKVNLEEYKKRRSKPQTNTEQISPTNSHKEIHKTQTSGNVPPTRMANTSSSHDCSADRSSQMATVTTTPKHSEAVTSIVKSLKEDMYQKKAADPITEAKNKVLRMQELKRAQQLRIIDSTISAKVPRVTKVLPLREIVKDSYNLEEDEQRKISEAKVVRTHPEYEEIIIVSASCNTDISIPPVTRIHPKALNNASRSLLKSSALLAKISNTFQKVKANENVKISTNSLIASIQDVIVKRTMPIDGTTATTPTTPTINTEEHGEDKIIMHLRKDRERKRTATVGIQTELQPEFPPLPLPKLSVGRKCRERHNRRRNRCYRKNNENNCHHSSSSVDSSDDSDFTHRTHISVDRSRNRSIAADDSCSSSAEYSRNCETVGAGSYSSRSSRSRRRSVSSSTSESAAKDDGRSCRHKRNSYKHRTINRSCSSSTSLNSDHSTRSHNRNSRSRSSYYRRSRSRARHSKCRYNRNHRNISQPAVEERRIVYVGRIEQETTKEMLRRKFIAYGRINQITIHYKDTGMKYGFVTYERSEDAFEAIDNSGRDPQISMYDVSFGGRRAFCGASYADLDDAGINTYESYVFPNVAPQPEEDSFETLLLKMKAKLSAKKSSNSTSKSEI